MKTLIVEGDFTSRLLLLELLKGYGRHKSLSKVGKLSKPYVRPWRPASPTTSSAWTS